MNTPENLLFRIGNHHDLNTPECTSNPPSQSVLDCLMYHHGLFENFTAGIKHSFLDIQGSNSQQSYDISNTHAKHNL